MAGAVQGITAGRLTSGAAVYRSLVGNADAVLDYPALKRCTGQLLVAAGHYRAVRLDDAGRRGQAEFLRTRNYDYIRAAQALGVSDRAIILRHMLPNAMVATLTFLPFILCSSITTLTSLDFLGFGLPLGSPSLGELLLQGKTTCRRHGWASPPFCRWRSADVIDFYW